MATAASKGRLAAMLVMAMLAVAWGAALAEDAATVVAAEDDLLGHSRELKLILSRYKPKTEVGKMLLKKALKIKKILLSAGAILADWLADGLAGEDSYIKTEEDIENLDLGSVCNTALEAGLSCEYVMKTEYPELEGTLRSAQKVVTVAEGDVAKYIEEEGYEFVGYLPAYEDHGDYEDHEDEEQYPPEETKHYEYVEVPAEKVEEGEDDSGKEYIEVDGKYYEVDYVDYVPAEEGKEGEVHEVIYVSEKEAEIEDDPDVLDFKLKIIDMLRNTAEFKREGERYIKKMIGKI